MAYKHTLLWIYGSAADFWWNRGGFLCSDKSPPKIIHIFFFIYLQNTNTAIKKHCAHNLFSIKYLHAKVFKRPLICMFRIHFHIFTIHYYHVTEILSMQRNRFCCRSSLGSSYGPELWLNKHRQIWPDIWCKLDSFLYSVLQIHFHQYQNSIEVWRPAPFRDFRGEYFKLKNFQRRIPLTTFLFAYAVIRSSVFKVCLSSQEGESAAGLSSRMKGAGGVGGGWQQQGQSTGPPPPPGG